MVNDKALLIILAYTIGFITAYIAFGLTGVNENGYEKTAYYSNVAEGKKFQVTGEVRGTRKVDTRVTADGLYALIDGSERVLSAQAISATEGKPGYHHEIVITEVSPDGQYIFYCAQLTASSQNCSSFVYEISSDSIYRVKHDGSQIALSAANAQVRWTVSGDLQIDGHLSSGKPWNIVD